MRWERRAGPLLHDFQPRTPNSSEQSWDARSVCTVNAGNTPEHQYDPTKGTTANSVSRFILLLAKCHYLFPTWVCNQIFGSCRSYLLEKETENYSSYFLSAISFLYKLIESALGTGWLVLPGTIIICSQFKMKFLMVASQIVPCVKVTLCGLACQLPACPFSASAPGLPASLFYTPRHTPTITGPLCVQARVR